VSFSGDRDQFYDGFHIKRGNARKMIRRIVAAVPSAFAATTARR